MKQLFLEVNGQRYEGFTQASVSKSMETLSGTFSLSATSSDITLFPVEINDSCRILVGDTPVLTGFVEKLSISSDASNHTISVSGRDKTCDIIDSSLDDNIEFATTVTLKKVIERVVSLLGLSSSITVIDNVSSLKAFEKSELVSSEAGKTAFSFIEQYCRKRQVLCASDGDGNIVLQRSSTTLLPVPIVRQVSGGNNNVLASSVDCDWTGRFNQVTVKSQFNPSVCEDTVETNVDYGDHDNDTKIRESRKMVMVAESSTDTLTAKERATWEVNIRRARSIIYKASVVGFTTQLEGSTLWWPNMLVKVKDDYCDINAQMLIKDVEFSISESGGSITNLTLVAKDAFSLQAVMDEAQENANNLGTSLVEED